MDLSMVKTEPDDDDAVGPDISDTMHSSSVNFLDIPWSDVIFPYVLIHLSWRDLYRLRRVSHSALNMINDYFKSMTVVDLGSVSRRFTAQAFQIVSAECTNLRILNLTNCKWLNNDILIPVIERNPNILVLDISSCYELTNLCLQKLAVQCKSLKTLKLKECHWVNASTICDIAIHCPNLEDVDLTSCWEVSDDAAIELIVKCPNLKRLSLSRIYSITDRTLTALASNSIYLEYLNASGCWRITDFGIRMIGEYCRSLNHVIVADCRDVTDDGLTYLKAKGIFVDVPVRNRPLHLSLYLNNFGRIRLQV